MLQPLNAQFDLRKAAEVKVEPRADLLTQPPVDLSLVAVQK